MCVAAAVVAAAAYIGGAELFTENQKYVDGTMAFSFPQQSGKAFR